MLAALSTNRREQLDALAGLDAFGTTGLYDSIVAAIEAIQPARGRRALILLSDGDDRYSKTTAPRRWRVRAPPTSSSIRSRSAERARRSLRSSPTLTGGGPFTSATPASFPKRLQTIAAELRHQYLLGYSPAKPPVAGSNEWRSITVTVAASDVTVRARDGYLVK